MKTIKLGFYLTILLQLIRIVFYPFDWDTISIIILCVGLIASINYIEKIEE